MTSLFELDQGRRRNLALPGELTKRNALFFTNGLQRAGQVQNGFVGDLSLPSDFRPVDGPRRCISATDGFWF